ncbi:MAG: hypothetical protein UR85_C0009G0040 [Candidatus Nomurabacteria bacterium GW2011_GWF2_35_66]|uniref:Uncharacterized protein n=1 Tax=Candidatus Nomurabacteria bacterium GW2011_GWE1_35_16 TaxID=1618761 RepID=A0A0G0B9E7_9BACT|nr:MAG: hypothetical protein UR55_C0014G0040 [Candidatus Nomurabacteria bacterium GW2011_GWF1_34_20]KKP62077.1 MAG: hypothetical protein UR57_C0013G0002 [Candidatus Nomurabacteria bacterium GW2011_GWE2_34_25]KKP66043.1 MAG: hypothetical protein UR64_C0013G0002 [Candidatus Nomurabacteria bacterium GW2011_GWE1_35_16]KKP83051.1 MAG: hypothetical protein UR85_C0009G0040 [Candidatus Nomurabacteria bacterium GW2011_GWF2_35_66]HAE36951.1 hypothetical protein [Candidatus Nomurabacteria bacterium]
MITSDLIEYIKIQLNKNISKDLIISRLSQVGWRAEDIEEGFLSIETSLTPPVLEASLSAENLNKEEDIKIKDEDGAKTVDPYRELPDGVELESREIYRTPNFKKEEIHTPPTVEKTTEKIEPVKIWAPTTIPTKIEETKITPEPKKEEAVEFSTNKEVAPYRLEVEGGEKPNTDEIKKSSDLEFIPTINKNPFSNPITQTIDKVESPLISREFIPSTEKNPSSELVPQKVNLPPLKISNTKTPIPEKRISDMVQKSAMISSYSQDILAAKKEEPIITKKSNLLLKIGILMFIIGLVGGMVFAFVEGYLRIPWLNINLSVVKKDPKTIILNTSSSLSKLKSYKVENNISISSPSLSNITTGLSSGSVVASKDRDSISVNTKGIVNHLNNKLMFDYILNLESSILENDINSNWKYNGTDLYVSIPDLNQVLGSDAPVATAVSLKPDQLNLIIPELSSEMQKTVKDIDIYNLMSGEVPLYIKNEVSSIFKEFINNLEYSEKADENIRGVDTYHYELTADRQSTKKFLTSLTNIFVVKLTADQKSNLDEVLGSSSISSFEVWIGKNDDNLYQIKFTLNTPLSKVLDLNDSGIAGNEVKLDWMITYYDLDVPNNINFPDAQLDMIEFIKSIRDVKIKNFISSFRSHAVLFKNAVGSFGTRSNPAGSCTNPNPGSIFSPKGHNKGADQSVGSIAEIMNSLLSITNGAGSCYSTSREWALSAPLSTVTEGGTSNFYCVDTTGNTTILQTPITGPACK